MPTARPLRAAHGFAPCHARRRLVGAEHEGHRRGRDRVVRVLVVRGAVHERDVARHLVAAGVADHVEPGGRGLHVVDAQVERRDRAQVGQRGRDRDAGAVVEQRCDDTAVDHAGRGVADQLRVVRHLEPGLAGLGVDHHEAERDGVRHVVDQQTLALGDGVKNRGCGRGLATSPTSTILRAVEQHAGRRHAPRAQRAADRRERGGAGPRAARRVGRGVA